MFQLSLSSFQSHNALDCDWSCGKLVNEAQRNGLKSILVESGNIYIAQYPRDFFVKIAMIENDYTRNSIPKVLV